MATRALPAGVTRSRGTVPEVPQRDPQFRHLAMDGLRAYRRELGHEEARVSYWRRLVQTRMDILADEDAHALTRLRTSLATELATRRHTAVLHPAPSEDLPPLPDLVTLWSLHVDAGTPPAERAAIMARLASAERELSAYRAALHRRLDRATVELVARYRENPTACLDILPRPPGTRR
ncbi:MAG: RsiG family protein [Actinomycetes bacterium]